MLGRTRWISQSTTRITFTAMMRKWHSISPRTSAYALTLAGQCEYIAARRSPSSAVLRCRTAHGPHWSRAAFSKLSNGGLCASASVPQQSASVVLEAFAEAISPQTVQALRRELEAATATAADLRIEVGHLNRQSDCSTLEQQLKAAVEDRRAAERKYQDAVSREAATKAELNAVEGQARRAVPEIQQLRTELRRLQEENLRLEKQRSDRQNELDAVRTDTTESLDRLSRELTDADREVAAWKKRCADLERERDAMQRSYRTAEEALQLSLSRTERQLFEVRAAQSSAVSSKPRSLAPDEDDTIELRTRLQRVEAHLRERTLQLAAALKTRAT
jgi:chromosome segregation ATPase